VASEILGLDKPIRTGVVNGSENTLRTEYTEARLPEQTQRGRLLKEQMADEQTALSQYAENIRNETNAQRNATDYARGERVNSALATDEGLTGLFKTEKNAIHILNAVSPGWTSAIPFARWVIEQNKAKF
jgi:hypothetical protein